MHSDFVPGCFRMSCDICGRVRLFPDEIGQCDDNLWRCFEACMEETTRTIDERIRASHFKREAPDPTFGHVSQFDRPNTFLADAVERRSVAIPGWTPSTTFYDDFSVLPGAVGSSWTTQLTGAATITAGSPRGAKFTAPAAGDLAKAWVTSVTIPHPTVGRFFGAWKFSSPTTNGTLAATTSDFRMGVQHLVAGVPSGANILGGFAGVTSLSRYFFGATPLSTTYLTDDPVILYVWWTGTGRLRFSFNGEPWSIRTATIVNDYAPWIGNVNNGNSVATITDVVYMV